MAEKKYDMLLVKTGNNPIIQQPWYKERLELKYLKQSDTKGPSQVLIGKDWVFLKHGVDDFRDGLPPPADDNIFTKQERGLAPNITGSAESVNGHRSVKQAAVHNRFTKEEVCFQKTTPLAQQSRDHIEELEYGLLEHPLALFPHFQESLPPEVFRDVVEILDPEMNILDDESEMDSGSNSAEMNGVPDAEDSGEITDVTLEAPKTEGEVQEEETSPCEDTVEENVPNPFKWLPKKEEKELNDKKKQEMRSVSAAESKHIQAVTRDFCQWVVGLGGEANNIEESTMTSLFASGYETKPALSVPIHVVELTSIPPELRGNVAMPQQAAGPGAYDKTSKPKVNAYASDAELSKFRYGAWYLPRKHWRKMEATEPLRDPKELLDTKQVESRQRSEALDTELAPMHGAKSFMEFIEKKGTRKPEFLNSIAAIQKKTEQEEKERLEAELAKKSGRKTVVKTDQNAAAVVK